jgi:LAO/AO transport system kinase
VSSAAPRSLAARLLRGEAAALARAITRVESGAPEALELLRAIHPHLGRALSIGVTGPPGAGKSTLVNALVHRLRARELRVGVIAVDPSSPLSGGAVLGDRVRMGDHDLDPGVFIRSLSSRGERGGLSVAAARTVDLMDAAGYERVILETVGAGQSEVDIAELADARVVVCAPGLGDDIQAVKSGILEIADVLVVNKADAPGADKLVRELRSALALRRGTRAQVEVVQTTATRGEGVESALAAIESVLAAGAPERVARVRRRLRRVLAKAAASAAERRVLDGGDAVDALCEQVHRGELALADAAEAMLAPGHRDRQHRRHG